MLLAMMFGDDDKFAIDDAAHRETAMLLSALERVDVFRGKHQQGTIT